MDDPPKPALLKPKVRFREVSTRDRGYLPHWERDSAAYFVTFRLADSLPKTVKGNTVRFAHKELDQHHGRCWLREPSVAAVVENSIHFLDGKRYRLLAWCVMPNHVHLVFRLLPGQQLNVTMHSLKSFTANKCNEILGRKGPFWQREYFDRMIRNEAELARAIGYVVENPAAAGLEHWPWVGKTE